MENAMKLTTLNQIFFLFILLLIKQDIMYGGKKKSHATNHKHTKQLIIKKNFEKPIDVFTTKKEKNKSLKLETISPLQERLVRRIRAELPMQRPIRLSSNNILIMDSNHSVHDSCYL